MLTAIVGINWGDEGKGRMVDLLTEEYDIVVRFQGGGNAGHTVINEKEGIIGLIANNFVKKYPQTLRISGNTRRAMIVLGTCFFLNQE